MAAAIYARMEGPAGPGTREPRNRRLDDWEHDLGHPVSHNDLVRIAEVDLSRRISLLGILSNPLFEDGESLRDVLVGPLMNQHRLAASRKRAHLDALYLDSPVYLEPNLDIGLLSREGVVASVGSAQHSRSGIYELIAQYVKPHFQGTSRNRIDSMNWARDNRPEFIGAVQTAIMSEIQKHANETFDKKKKSGA